MAKKPSTAKPILTQHERAVITAAAAGEIADFSDLKTPPVLRAKVLRLLITGLAQKRRKSADPVTPRGVRVRGAVIGGELDLSGWTGRADDPSRPLPALEFIACTLTHPLYLDESRIGSLSVIASTGLLISAGSARIIGSVRLNGSHLTGADDKYAQKKLALDFAGTKIGGNVIMRPHEGTRFCAKNECTFLGAQIEGAFNANGALLENPGGVALNFTRADIRNSLFLTSEAGYRFEAHGETRLWIAQIGGQFAANGALLQNPEGEALSLNGAHIRGNVFLLPSDTKKPFTAHGGVSFGSARIESNLISRAIDMQGVFDVRNAHIGALFDDATSGWPVHNGGLRLSGLTYNRLHGDADDNRDNRVATRLSWIKRQYRNPDRPTCTEFDPQPFHQYAQFLRARGQIGDADQVLIEMQELRLASRVDHWSLQIIQRFLGLTCRFGYSGTRAVMALMIWVLIGSGMYGAHAYGGNFGPADAVLEGNHHSIIQTQVSIPGLGTRTVRGCPGLIAPLYAMDTILPIVEFGQRRACALDPQGPRGAPLWRTLDLFYALIGGILFAITVVTLTGLLRED